MNITDRTALVTGGASGLGKATVELLSELGAKVAILDMNREEGEKLVNRIGASALFIETDVSREEQVKSAIDQVSEHFGALHICCNFAGIGGPRKTLNKEGPYPLDEFKRRININLIGTFDVLRLAAEKMSQNDPQTEDGEKGVIINTASVAAYEGQVGQVAYSASKAGIVGMTLPIARDLASYGIRVNTIVPGIIGTPLMLGAPDKVKDALLGHVQFPKRFGRPQEIAKLVLTIVENEYINGECIRLDGAIRMPAR